MSGSEKHSIKKHHAATKNNTNNFVIIALLIFIFPVGLYLMFKKSGWSKKSKIIATTIVAVFVVLFIIAAIFAPPSVTLDNLELDGNKSIEGDSFTIKGTVYPYDSIVTVNSKKIKIDSQGKLSYKVPLEEGDNNITIVAKKEDKKSTSVYKVHRYTKAEIAKQKADGATRLKREEEVKAAADKKAADIKAAKEAADTKAKSDAKAKADADAVAAAAKAKADAATVSQKNALNKAKSYLSYTAFSHDGLVDQLVYEQFSVADATYGADNVGANWNEQAAKKAKDYMSHSSFSHGGLIDQLEYEKFTPDQATYGANSVGL